MKKLLLLTICLLVLTACSDDELGKSDKKKPNKVIYKSILSQMVSKIDKEDKAAREKLLGAGTNVYEIKTDRTAYAGLNTIDVWFSVDNKNNEDDIADINFIFSEGNGNLVNLQEFATSSEITYEPIMENGDSYDCYDPVSQATSTCYYQVQTGTSTVETITDVVVDVSGKVELPAKTIKYFKALLDIGDSGEFDIEVAGENGYGYLDPAFSGAGSWTRKLPIGIDPSKVAGTDNLTNYPVLFTSANFNSEIFTLAKSDGCDLRFSSDSAGATELASEKVRFATSTSIIEWYVNVASVSFDATTTIYAWYGNASASCYNNTDTYGRDNTWNSDYKAVYHMEDADATTVYDSSGTGNNATKASANNPNTDTGKINNSQYFAGDANDYLKPPDEAFSAVNSGSVQTWVKVFAAAGTYHIFGSQASSGLYFGQRSSNKPYVQFYPTPSEAFETTNVLGANFSHMTWESNGSAWSSYLNGGSAETLVSIAGSNNGKWFNDLGLGTDVTYLGRTPYSGYYLNGWLDEWRFSSAQFTAGWNTTDYNNQNSPQSFAIEGTPEDVTAATGSGEGYIILFE